jgi:hypothetical protein
VIVGGRRLKRKRRDVSSDRAGPQLSMSSWDSRAACALVAEPVRADVRLASSTHTRGLVPASDVSWLATHPDSSWRAWATQPGKASAFRSSPGRHAGRNCTGVRALRPGVAGRSALPGSVEPAHAQGWSRGQPARLPPGAAAVPGAARAAPERRSRHDRLGHPGGAGGGDRGPAPGLDCAVVCALAVVAGRPVPVDSEAGRRSLRPVHRRRPCRPG